MMMFLCGFIGFCYRNDFPRAVWPNKVLFNTHEKLGTELIYYIFDID